MSSDTKQGWKPRDAVVYKAIDAYERAPGVLQFKAMRHALVAAVDADPLLSAAKDMQEALADLVALVERVGDGRKDAPFIEAGLAALSKSRGEGL
jgi:hypothetical protein